MKHCVSSVLTRHGHLRFYFNAIEGEGSRYHVSVLDPAGGMEAFFMERTGEHWRIVAPPETPAWIVDVELALSFVISSQDGDS